MYVMDHMVQQECKICKNKFETKSRALYCPNCRSEANRLRVKKHREEHPIKLMDKTAETLKDTIVYKNITSAYVKKIKDFVATYTSVKEHITDIKERAKLLDYHKENMDQGLSWSELCRASKVSRSVFNDYLKAFRRKDLLKKIDDRYYLGDKRKFDSMRIIHEDIFYKSSPQNFLQTMSCGFYFPNFDINNFSDEEFEIIKDTEQYFYQAQYALERALKVIIHSRQQAVWQNDFINNSSIFILTRFYKWVEFVFLKTIPYFIISNIIYGKKMPISDLDQLLPDYRLMSIDACHKYIFSHKYPNLAESVKEKLKKEIQKSDKENIKEIQGVFSEMRNIEYNFTNHMAITNSLDNVVDFIGESEDKEKKLQEYGKKMIDMDSFREKQSDVMTNGKTDEQMKQIESNFFARNDFFGDFDEMLEAYCIKKDELYSLMDYRASKLPAPTLPNDSQEILKIL